MIRNFSAFLILCCPIPIYAQSPAPLPTSPEQLVEQLPKGEVWLSHAIGDLMPFWIHPDALGTPLGAFPSTRCDNGTLPNYVRNTCPEIRNNGWLYYDRQKYLVALSRQVYGYGILFHLTGDPTFMDYMRAGVKYIRENVVDRKSGGLKLLQDPATGVWDPNPAFRDPQHLAYGLLGMSFYYYLTRDPEVLPDIIDVKNYIFNNYYNGDIGALQWTLQDNGSALKTQKKLVAQLDQMNAYLVMLAPTLPASDRADLEWALYVLSKIMIGQFYSEKENVFFLQVDKPSDLDINQTGTTDFGHTIKAMWMIRNTGLMIGDQELIDFAETKGRKVLDRAYQAESGSWASGPLKGGTLDLDKSWWIYCELDQFSGTLAMRDPMVAKYLPNTNRYWLDKFVDHTYGEVWTTVDGKTHLPKNDNPKAWPWKNAYHTMEHALVGYITSQQLHGEPVTLYFNFVEPQEDAAVKPYFFTGSIDSKEVTDDSRGGSIQKVMFRDVK
jgi:mannose/cellobiose epimerase-like protein (N-acyl-D-glucosamine 2-epimerase family)